MEKTLKDVIENGRWNWFGQSEEKKVPKMRIVIKDYFGI